MPRTGRPPLFDAYKQHTFLRLVALGFPARQAARHVGVSPSTVREKVRTSQDFASRYEQAKGEAVPALAERVREAGVRSWRASAWLLERLQAGHFGRRVALGVDRGKIHEQRRLLKIEEARQRNREINETTIRGFMNCLRGNREAQAFAKQYLREVLYNQAYNDVRFDVCDDPNADEHYFFEDPNESADDPPADSVPDSCQQTLEQSQADEQVEPPIADENNPDQSKSDAPTVALDSTNPLNPTFCACAFCAESRPSPDDAQCTEPQPPQ